MPIALKLASAATVALAVLAGQAPAYDEALRPGSTSRRRATS